MLTVSASSPVTQTNTLVLGTGGTGGTATFSAGSYSISAGGMLQANTITVSGATLAGAGSVMIG